MNTNRLVKKRKLVFLFVIMSNLLFVTSFASAVNIGVSPATISFEEVMREGYAETTIVISSDSEDPIGIELQTRGDVAEWLGFTDQDISVSRGEPYYLKVSVTPPMDMPNGDYTGFLRILTDSFGESIEGSAVGKIKSSLDLAIGVEVTDVEIVECSVSSFEMFSAEKGEDVILKMNVLNSGNVRLKPTVVVDIWDADQIQIVKTKTFTGDEVLPTVDGSYEFRLDSKGLDLGQYWSEVSILECFQSNTLTFDILEPGALTVKGILLGILTKKEVDVGETTTIIVNFKNTGEKEVEAQFKGKVTLGGKIVQLLESEKIRVGISDIEKFNFYFTPEKAGRYIVSGRVFYGGKKTFESSAVLEAISKQKGLMYFVLPIVYTFFILVISILFFKIKKERRLYQNKLRRIKWGS